MLILDEATSHLDSENERLVHQALKRLMAGRTTLMIAHRLSTVREADHLVVLDEGAPGGTGHARRVSREGWRLCASCRHERRGGAWPHRQAGRRSAPSRV